MSKKRNGSRGFIGHRRLAVVAFGDAKKVMKNMRLLITGATGFLGKSFINYIRNYKKLSEYTNICCISSGRTSFDQSLFEDVDFIKMDLTRRDNLAELKELKFDCLIHLATSSTLVKTMRNSTILSEIIDVGRSALEIAKITKCSKIIWASSGAVYQKNTSKVPVEEHFYLSIGTEPQSNAYSAGKIISELDAAYFCSENEIDLTVLRLFAFSGCGLPLNRHFALGNFISSARSGGPILIRGSGSLVRSYMDQLDFAKALTSIIEQDLKGGTFNVGSDVPITLTELAELISKISNQKFGAKITKTILNEVKDPEGYYVPNIDKFKSYFNIAPIKTLEASIYEMLKE